MSKHLNKGISTPIAITIIVIFVVILVGGVFAYKYWWPSEEEIGPSEEEIGIEENEWTEPVTSEASGVEWPGVITSIDMTSKIIKAIRMPGKSPKITVLFSDSTEVKDKLNNTLSLNDLKLGNVISISGEYQMKGKFTDNWEVKVNKTDEIVFLGECVKEGGEIDITEDLQCCPELTLIEQKYCAKCGDAICKPPENQENCPLDCTKVSEAVSISMFIDIESFDLDNKTFEGQTRPENKRVKVLTTASTKFYRTAGLSWEKEYFTFSEFHSLLKNWSGPMWPFTVKGILEKEGVIRASEVFYFVQ